MLVDAHQQSVPVDIVYRQIDQINIFILFGASGFYHRDMPAGALENNAHRVTDNGVYAFVAAASCIVYHRQEKHGANWRLMELKCLNARLVYK